MLCFEQDDDWLVGRAYLSAESIALVLAGRDDHLDIPGLDFCRLLFRRERGERAHTDGTTDIRPERAVWLDLTSTDDTPVPISVACRFNSASC
jgi:hypothetical protein